MAVFHGVPLLEFPPKSCLPDADDGLQFHLEKVLVPVAILGGQLEKFLIGMDHFPFHGNDHVEVKEEIGCLLKLENLMAGVAVDPVGDL